MTAPTLSITTFSGQVGTPLTVGTSGDGAGGAITFIATNGTATGCTVSGDELTAKSAGTCIVSATRAASGTNPAVSSSATTITLAAAAVTARTESITLLFSPQSNALSAGSRKALQDFAKKLVTGHSIIITGYAKNNGALAISRAKNAAQYLLRRIKVHVTLESFTTTVADKVTMTTRQS